MTDKITINPSSDEQTDNELWRRFQFDVPIELVKSGETEAGWKIRGLASTESKDLQGEVVKQRGLDISPIKEGRGWINYNHSNEPEDMVGKLDDASISSDGLMVEGYLFKKHNRAQGIYQVLKSLDDKDRHAVKLSIEGKILKRAGRENKVIQNARVDKVAITFDPINTNTYVELCKAVTSPQKMGELMEKSLKAEEHDITQDNNIMTPDDQKQDNNSANAAGGAEVVSEKRGDGVDAPNSNYSGQHAPKEGDVHDLLVEIKDMLSVLISEKMAKDKEVAVKSVKALLSDRIKAKLSK